MRRRVCFYVRPSQKMSLLHFQPRAQSVLFTFLYADNPTIKPDKQYRWMFGIVSYCLILFAVACAKARRILGRWRHGCIPAATNAADRILRESTMFFWPGDEVFC